jgi:hypothetical protein
MGDINIQTSVTPQNIKPRVVQDTISISAQLPAAGNGYVMLALNTQIPNAPRVVVWGADNANPAFTPTANSKLFLTPRYLYGNSSILLKNASVAGKKSLKVLITSVNSADQPTCNFVWNGGGVGNDMAFANANGDLFTIQDIGDTADILPSMHWEPINSEFTVDKSDADGYDNLWTYDGNGSNAIMIRASLLPGQELYIDETTTTSEQLIQDSGSDITVTGEQSVGGRVGGNPLQQFWLQIYHNDSAPVHQRWQHNGGGGQVPFDIDVPMFSGVGLNGFMTVVYNADAAIDGKEVRYDNGFIADIASNSSAGLNPFYAPNSLTRL